MKEKVYKILVILVLFVAFTGCGGDGSPTGPTGPTGPSTSYEELIVGSWKVDGTWSNGGWINTFNVDHSYSRTYLEGGPRTNNDRWLIEEGDKLLIYSSQVGPRPEYSRHKIVEINQQKMKLEFYGYTFSYTRL